MVRINPDDYDVSADEMEIDGPEVQVRGRSINSIAALKQNGRMSVTAMKPKYRNSYLSPAQAPRNNLVRLFLEDDSKSTLSLGCNLYLKPVSINGKRLKGRGFTKKLGLKSDIVLNKSEKTIDSLVNLYARLSHWRAAK